MMVNVAHDIFELLSMGWTRPPGNITLGRDDIVYARAMELKTMFRQVDTDDVNLFHGFLLPGGIKTPPRHSVIPARRGRPPHRPESSGPLARFFFVHSIDEPHVGDHVCQMTEAA